MALFVLLIPVASLAMLQLVSDGEKAMADYAKAVPEDPIAALQRKIDSGAAHLEFDSRWGYLPSVLRELKIPESSQTLVFSRTSFQIDHIARKTPRALYFNDDTYVGWVQGGPVLEFASEDPKLGAIFYTMDQKRTDRPQFERLVEGCLVCHDSSSTGGIPGFMMRSLLVDIDGNPILSAGSSVMTDKSLMSERFGGWYVTGTSVGQLHRGNNYYPDVAAAMGNPKTYLANMKLAPTSNLTRLPADVDASRYRTRHSDIVALMVMSHQTRLHNLITQVTYEVRSAIHDEGVDPPVSEITKSRIRNVAEPLVKAMLFAWTPDEITAPVTGTSGFTEEFAKSGPFDRKGRTLRELDLKTRLFRYPLSYLVYSDAFNAMPTPAKNYVYRRFREILTGNDRSIDFSHLSDSDRTAILQILQDTKPEFAVR